MGSCPKCTGYLSDTMEGLFCVNCGCRPTVSLPVREVGAEPDGRGRPAKETPGGGTAASRIRARLKAAGCCVRCGLKRRTPAEPGKTLCAAHAQANRQAHAAWAIKQKRAKR